MPIYFNDVPPFCPVSRDQPVGERLGFAPTIRTVIPRAHDLPSAIAAVNIAISIINQIVRNTVRNNVYSKPPPKDKTVDKSRKSRWSEDKSKRIRRKYKYFGKNDKGEKDKDTWVMMERIERMVWVDKGWKTSLAWSYGNKGEGELVGGGGAGTGGSPNDSEGPSFPIEPPIELPPIELPPIELPPIDIDGGADVSEYSE